MATMSKRRVTMFVWVLWAVHLLANVEAWRDWKRKTGRVRWLPAKDDRWR